MAEILIDKCGPNICSECIHYRERRHKSYYHHFTCLAPATDEVTMSPVTGRISHTYPGVYDKNKDGHCDDYAPAELKPSILTRIRTLLSSTHNAV